MFYINKSHRPIYTEIKQHITCTKKLDTEVSAPTKHSTETKHLVLFYETTVLATIYRKFSKERLRKPIEIKKTS